MKIEMEKTVDKCNVKIELKINGVQSNYGRTATGHTEGDNKEILNDDCLTVLYYGRHEKEFDFSVPSMQIWGPAINVGDTFNALILRIETVRAWVDECKKSDAECSGIVSAEISDLDSLMKALKTENRLYYRNEAGQIKRLE